MSNPKSLVKSAIGVVGLLVLFGLSYAVSGDETPAKFVKQGVDASSSQFIGGALILTYILMALAFMSWIGSEVSKMFK
ncbi:hypothetical protein [Xanthovirga aplysinae]|uniref:hypothetical protein n=1 Tax=Xanthovirga aplysinae TaxID=2529853 RepID=UPI0012BB606C|nr:hypothetical protein [Xanthovirga aplysinae]